MLSVELDGTLGIIGYNKSGLQCYVCNKRCAHINAIEDPINSELPAIKEFECIQAISQKRYEKKCLSTTPIPFYVYSMEYAMMLQHAPHEYIMTKNEDDGLIELGKTWKCSCGGESTVRKHEIQSLFSYDFRIKVHGMLCNGKLCFNTQRAHVSRIHSWLTPSAYLEGLCIHADSCQMTYCWDVPRMSFQNVP